MVFNCKFLAHVVRDFLLFHVNSKHVIIRPSKVETYQVALVLSLTPVVNKEFFFGRAIKGELRDV